MDFNLSLKDMSGRAFLSVLFFFIAGLQAVFAQQQRLPFSVTLEEITHNDWPGLHSFAYGKWDGRWIIAGGRRDGLHTFLPPSPFPVTEANTDLWLLDPQTGDHWSKSIYTLPPLIAAQLRASNAEYFQRDKCLYIVGGYGADTLTDQKITFPSMLAIDLDMLTDILISEGDPAPAFRRYADTMFTVTGGEIEMLEDTILLFGGHVFTGDYTKPATSSFTQVYTNTLTKFLLDDDGTDLLIHDVQHITDSINFHRRDLNFEPVMYAGEEKGLVAYSGVFQYDGDIPWPHALYFNSDGSYMEDTDFDQKTNNYTCPVMSVFDSSTNNFYATFFGGISQYYFNATDSTLHQDLNIPFVKDITTLVRYADDSVRQFVNDISFDALLGSNAIFDIDADIAQYDDRIIKLHDLNGDYFAGYIFGGISASLPNFTPSEASNRLFKVMLHYIPEEPPLHIPSIETYIQVYPNPAHDLLHIQNNSGRMIRSVQLCDAQGSVIYNEKQIAGHDEELTLNTASLSAGIYLLQIITDEGTAQKKIVIN